jgi:HNH endonuclease
MCFRNTKERLLAQVNKNGPIPACRPELGPCWIWLGHSTEWGYGRVSYQGKNVRIHRLFWEWSNGPIPADKEPDHLCRVRLCVNPGHMELVTGRENTLRGFGATARNARKTHCIHGHELKEGNIYRSPHEGPTRRCIICRKNGKHGRSAKSGGGK